LCISAQKNPVTVLDVGGGAGIIAREMANYIKSKFGYSTRKFALDLSPGMIEIQKNNNPDMANAVVGDIAHTPYRDKEIDVVLMIDVLEHVTDPEAVLREIARISHYLILKVPLENSLYFKLLNLFTRGKFRERIIAQIGHINVYGMGKLLSEVEKNAGSVVYAGYANAYKYLLTTKQTRVDRWFNRLGSIMYHISPALAGLIFYDFAMVVVKCKDEVSSIK
jgi:ubiquinone/menaquinone biosynthesis C-methylase UbiE